MKNHPLRKSPHSLGDAVGVVLIGDNMVYRVINDEHVGRARSLLNSGLIEKLVSVGLFPETAVSSSSIPGYSLVLEHENLHPLVYPYEWSPEMLRRAGLCILETNRIANEFGYELKDAHPYNVVFRCGHPVFVDFGSFIEKRVGSGWGAFGEFLGCYYYPLVIYRRGLRGLFRHLFLLSGRSLPLSEHLILSGFGFGFVPSDLIEKTIQLWLFYINSSQVTDEQIVGALRPGFLRHIAFFVKRHEWLPFKGVDLQRAKARLTKLQLETSTEWGDYQRRSGFYSATDAPVLTPRLKRVLQIVEELGSKTVLELAGNQGILARGIAKLPHVLHVVCADYDESAIDKMLKVLQPEERITPAVFNLMGESVQEASSSRCERLKSELVIALAVTHHLLLTQGYSIDNVIDKMFAFSSRYIILEFMPLGLWDGMTSPSTPSWYSEQWFEASLQKHSRLLSKEKLERNRVLYVLELHGPSNRLATIDHL